MVAGQQRTIQNLHLRMLRRCTDTRIQKYRGRRKDDLRALRDQFLNGHRRILLHHIFTQERFHALAEGLLQSLSSKLVPVCPARFLRRTVEQESAAQGLRLQAQHRHQQSLLLFGWLAEQRGRLAGSSHRKLGLNTPDLLPDFMRRLAQTARVPVNLQVHKQRVGYVHWQVAALQRHICLGEAVVDRLEIKRILSRPRLARRLTQQFIQARKIAFMIKVHAVQMRVLIKGKVFLIDPVAFRILRFGNHANHVGLNEYRIKHSGNADPLVALHNIELIVVLERFDRLTQPVLFHVIIQRNPF